MMFVEPRVGDTLLCYNPSFYRDLIVGAEDVYLTRLEFLRRNRRPPKGRPVYSHTAIYAGDGMVIEALGRGVVRSNLDKYYNVADIWSMPEFLKSLRKRSVANAEKRIDDPYAWLDIANQAVRMFFGVRLKYHFDQSVICSVLDYDRYASVGRKVSIHRNCSPEDEAIDGYLQYIGIFGGR